MIRLLPIEEWNCSECHRITKNKKEKFCYLCGRKLHAIKRYVYVPKDIKEVKEDE